MDVKKEDYQKFHEYMYNLIGKNLIPKSKNIICQIKYYLINREYEESILSISEKYENIQHKILRDITKCNQISRHIESKKEPEKYILFIYLENYLNGDIVQEKNFSEISNELYSIKPESVITSGISSSNANEFKSINFNDGYSHFIVDKANELQAKEIVKFIIGKEVNIIDVRAKNMEYDIDDLIVFEINNKRDLNTDIYIGYEILSMLLDAGINNCIYHDIDGEIDKQLDIRIRNRADSRKSSLGFRVELGRIFRSSWEADFARILNHLEIEWDYEREGFDLESKYIEAYYLPDFFLDNNVIVELKGFWDADSRKKVRCFKEQYKNYKLLLIDSDMMISLSRLYCDKIHGWESKNISIKSQKVPVVGITIADRKNYINKIKLKDEVYLQREADNKYDKNAIKILDKNNNLLGYMSAEWATIYSCKLDLGMEFKAIVSKINDTVLTIDVKRINSESNVIYDFLK